MRQNYPLDKSQLERAVPSAFAIHAHHERSDRYRFIPTSAVIERLIQEGFSPVAAYESGHRKNSRAGFCRHQIRFQQLGQELRAVGDVRQEMVLTNAHDGTGGYELAGGFLRLACLNGLMVPDGVVQSVKVAHRGSDVIDRVIEGTFRVIEDMPRAEENMDEMKAIELSRGEQLALANAAIDLRWDRDQFRVEPADLVRPRRFSDKGNDLWTTFNRIQESVVRGGVIVENIEKKDRRRAREVKGITENNALNRGLWTLAEEMKKLKA